MSDSQNAPVIRDLAYYGGNANNMRYLEGLRAQKAASEKKPLTVAQDVAVAQAALAQMNGPAIPPTPENPPVWRGKA